MKNLLILVIMLGTLVIFSCGTENQINQSNENSQIVGELPKMQSVVPQADESQSDDPSVPDLQNKYEYCMQRLVECIYLDVHCHSYAIFCTDYKGNPTY